MASARKQKKSGHELDSGIYVVKHHYSRPAKHLTTHTPILDGAVVWVVFSNGHRIEVTLVNDSVSLRSLESTLVIDPRAANSITVSTVD